MNNYFNCNDDTYEHEIDTADIKCLLCPHKCRIKDSESGFCNIRKNIEGLLYLVNFGQVVSPVIDTLKKRPILTYEGDDSSLTLGLTGCNNRCSFCQNHLISTKPDYINHVYWTPLEVVKYALDNGVKFISFTYTEPLIWGEYVLEVAKLAKIANLKICIKTAANIDPIYHRRFIEVADVFNVDIKPQNDAFCRNSHVNTNLVSSFINKVFDLKKHIEISHIVIEGLNDNEEALMKFMEWLWFHREVPIHLLKHVPTLYSQYRITSLEKLEFAKEYLNKNGFSNVFINGD